LWWTCNNRVLLCRAIRKLVTNNKRRHSLILALHAAGDGTGYGNLLAVYNSVKSMHDGLAAGSGWTSEAGRCLCRVQLYDCALHGADANPSPARQRVRRA
jgi:hypothetical protein